MDELDPDDQYIPEDCLTSQSRIINACAGLIKVNEKTQIIGLVHYTTQEYFDQHGSLHFPNAQEDIAITCVKYLDLGTFSSGRCLTSKELDRRLNENPLLQYASRHFCDHIRVGMDSESVLKRQVQFFLNESRISCASQVLFLEQERIGFKIGSRISRRSFQGIHFAAYFGLSRVIVFLSETCNVDARDYKNRTALSYAAERGHECAAKELVEHGARPDPETEDGWTPLSFAAFHGYESIVRLLLEHGARPDPETEDGWTPLLLAVWYGHESMVRLLQDHGARLDSKNIFGQTPLLFAALHGHGSIVRLLLDHGARLDSETEDGWTPLSFAAWHGHESMVRLLLDHGARPDSETKYGQTPLSCAAQSGHESIVRLLLEHGAKPLR
jgi:ankyrin repeat protein